jgi:signal transduction histidine kinase
MEIRNGTIWLQTDKIPFLNAQGDIVGIIGFAIDITERKAADDKIQKMNEELKESNFTKDKFFSIIAHDLKSPFQGLIGYSKILLEEYETLSKDERAESIKSIYELSKNTFELLDNLLVWSRIQTGKMTFDPDVFNLYQELSPTINLLIHTARKKNINIDYLVDKKTIVVADKNMLSTVIRNLISNAIKYTNPEGRIIVSSERVDKYLELSVADNGVGINDKVLNNLFKIDENVSTNGTADEEGTGLGLILCKEMIQMHKGKIWAESKVGKGSKFSFRIPIKI